MELINTCYRIADSDRSVAFYEALGFEKRRELPIRDEAVNIFMGLPRRGAGASALPGARGRLAHLLRASSDKKSSRAS